MVRKRNKRDSTFVLTATAGGVKLSRRGRTTAAQGELLAASEGEAVAAARTTRGGSSVGGTDAGCNKRPVREFSRASRLNMRWTFNALPWGDVPGRLAMVTLTYPREFPMSGPLVKKNMEAFKMRWLRKWGTEIVGAWVLEFQERGAPHIHAYVGLPAGATLEWHEGWQRDMWTWALDAWDGVVCSGDPVHKRYGVDVRPCFFGGATVNANRVADYFWRESGKYGQKTVPDGFENVGRFWGVWGKKSGFKPVLYEREVTADQFIAIRRQVRVLRDKRAGRKVAKPRGLDGMWVLAVDGLSTAVNLQRWAEGLGTT